MVFACGRASHRREVIACQRQATAKKAGLTDTMCSDERADRDVALRQTAAVLECRAGRVGAVGAYPVTQQTHHRVDVFPGAGLEQTRDPLVTAQSGDRCLDQFTDLDRKFDQARARARSHGRHLLRDLRIVEVDGLYVRYQGPSKIRAVGPKAPVAFGR